MFVHTDTDVAPWYVVEADVKRNARLNCIAHLLSMVPYEVHEAPRLDLPKRQPDEGYVRPDRSTMTYVPEYTATRLQPPH